MMVKIIRQIVSSNVRNQVTYGNKNKKTTVTVHQTGNTNRGANAEMHARIQSNGNSRAASWHYQVDDAEAYQSFEDDTQCWHAGDGRGNGNLNSIAVEICINSDGDYKKAVENGAELVKHLLDKHGLSINDVKQHYDWSRKNCPAQIRAGKDGIDWNDFLAMVEGKESKQQTSSSTTSNKGVKWIGTDLKGKRVESIYRGSEGLNFYDSPRWNNPSGTFGYGEGWIVDNKYMVNGSPQYRVQNSKGDLYFITASPKYVRVVGASGGNKNVTSYTGDSIVDYLDLKGNEHLGGSSMSNRRKLARQHGIKNYRGTASQNKRLLNALRR